MDLQTGDYIIIRDYNKDNFFSEKHFRKLLNKPTRVWDWGNKGIYVSHPDWDLVPLNDDVVYDKIIDSKDLPGHKEYKSKFGEFSKLTGRADVPDEKPLLKFLRKKNIKEEEEQKPSKIDEKLIGIVEKLNDGELDIEFINKFMGGLDTFISLLQKRNLLYLINPFNKSFEDIQNSLFYAFYQNDKSFIWKLVDQYISDVTKIGDEYYLDIDPSDLAGLFKTSRSDISEKSIESIISGEHEFDSWDVTDDEYNDVYQNLKPEHKNTVNDRVRSELGNYDKLSIEYRSPDLFEKIAEEQGTDGEINIDDSVINRLISDQESMRYLINQELDDVKRELYSLYSMCYQDALHDEWYNSIMSELEGYVIDDRKGEQYSYKKETWNMKGDRVTKTFYGNRYKATKCIYNIVTEWLDENKDKDGFSSNTIEYFGSLLGLLKDSVDYGYKEGLRVPTLDDYPDYRKIERCINDNFSSYF
jgi:hypothetical protein